MIGLFKMCRDYSRSLAIQKVSADEFHKEKVQSKKEKALKYSLCAAAPSPQTKSGRERPLSDCFFFLEGRKQQQSIFFNSDFLRLLAGRIFSDLEEISADH